MGMEWLYKAGHGGAKSQSTEANKQMNGKTRKEKNNSSSGCMSAIFNLFDIQHHQFRFHHPSFISESTIINSPQGIEAPRNSLESPESTTKVASSSSLKVKEQTNFNIPMSGIQIKTKGSRLTGDISSECSSSPGTKTANLVARLMGLDQLPEYSSPRPSSSSTPVNSHHRSRSLPTTPRTSIVSRQSTDNDYHHRISLQIDKENHNCCSGHDEHESLQKKLALRRAENLANRKDQNVTSEYATQVSNQVRERIKRLLGTDITNTVSSRNKEKRRDSNLVMSKPKKPATPPQAMVKSEQNDLTSNSSSPKPRLLDVKSNLNKSNANSHSLRQQEKLVKETKIKKIASERYDLRLKNMNNQQHVDAMFATKIYKINSTSLSNDVMKVKNTTKFHSFKKELTSPSLTTILHQKQVSLVSMTHSPSSLNSSYIHTLNLGQRDRSQVVPNTISSSKGYKFKYHQHHMFKKSDVENNIISDQLKSVQSTKCDYRLIENDLGLSIQLLKLTEFQAEVEEIVKDIENEIVASLVHEMVVNDDNGWVNWRYGKV